MTQSLLSRRRVALSNGQLWSPKHGWINLKILLRPNARLADFPQRRPEIFQGRRIGKARKMSGHPQRKFCFPQVAVQRWLIGRVNRHGLTRRHRCCRFLAENLREALAPGLARHLTNKGLVLMVGIHLG